MKKQMKKFLALTMSAVMGLGMLSINPVDKVDARADGHYYVGMFDAKVSEYLNVRKDPNTWCLSVAKIPAGATFAVTRVEGNMGLVSNGYYNSNGKYVRFSPTSDICGWVNLDFADEDYKLDLSFERLLTGGMADYMSDLVPDGKSYCDYWKLDWISLRSEPNTWSTCKKRLYPDGVGMQRSQVDNGIMSKVTVYEKVQLSSNTTGLRRVTGWINLDYTATFG